MCEKLFIQNDDLPKRMLKQILSINVGIWERYSYSCLRNEMSNKLGVLSFVFARKTQQENPLRISPQFFWTQKKQQFFSLQVDVFLVFLSELVPLTFALRSFFLRRGFWHGYMQGAPVRRFFCGGGFCFFLCL